MITISMTSMAAARKVVKKTVEWLTAKSPHRVQRSTAAVCVAVAWPA
jgi:hypothetical protein